VVKSTEAVMGQRGLKLNKIYRSSDGTTWAEVEDLSDLIVYAFEEFNGYLYAGTENLGKIYKA